MSAPPKAPAFQLYAGDFLSSPDVMLMEAHEVGAYCLLLFTAWQSEPQGYLENDEDRMRRIARLTREQWTESRSVLLRKFIETEDKTFRYNPRLAQTAEKQEAHRKQMKENGSKGGRPTKNNQLVSENNQLVSVDKPQVSFRNQIETSSSSSKQKAPVAEATEFALEAPKLELVKTHQIASADLVREAVERTFAFYCLKFGRSAKQYTLTPERRKKAEARMRERLKAHGGDVQLAEADLIHAIDNLAADDFCTSKGYIDWNAQLFKSQEELEKRLNQTKTAAANTGTKPLTMAEKREKREREDSLRRAQ
jgi:uncharacterized protein YdaU (DUF1376 family)